MCLFEGNTSILTLYAEADQPKHFLQQTIGSFVVIMGFSVAMGSLSYATYGKDVADIVLMNLPESGVADLTKLLYLFTIMGSFVILIQPVFAMVERGSDISPVARLSTVGALLLASMVLPDLNVVLTLSGSITGTIISIILPVVFYHKAYKKDKKWIKFLAKVVLVVGCTTGFLAFIDCVF
jgi:proton-coupled amino acid transporter